MTFTRSNANFTGTIVLLSPSFVAPAAHVITIVLFFVIFRVYIMPFQLCTFRCVGCVISSGFAVDPGLEGGEKRGQGPAC